MNVIVHSTNTKKKHGIDTIITHMHTHTHTHTHTQGKEKEKIHAYRT